MDIEGEFDFLQDQTHTDRDGYKQYVMHVNTGMVFGLSDVDGDNAAHYISTQMWEPDMLGSRGVEISAIRDFDTKTNIGYWDY